MIYPYIVSDGIVAHKCQVVQVALPLPIQQPTVLAEAMVYRYTIRYDTIEELKVDSNSKAERAWSAFLAHVGRKKCFKC